ncbi:MAG TPA: nucleotidyltransferase family protein [Clostridia bacterium]|jgi:hypothetical protein|nr:nucleotidyltransferase family protein [Clostridia bacterium]
MKSCIIKEEVICKVIELSKPIVGKKYTLNDAEITEIMKLSTFQGVKGAVLKNIMCNSRNDKYSNEFWLDKTVYLLKEKRIKKLLKIFNDSGITYTVIKGLSYNYNVYSSSELRHFGDVDILVSSKDTKRAHATLIKSDYNVVDDCLDCKSIKERFRYQSHLNLYKGDKLFIELHQAKNSYINLEEIVKNRQFVNDIYITDLIDTFIIACTHAWHHFSYSISSLKFKSQFRLKLLLDIYRSYLKINQMNIRDIELLERADTVKAKCTVLNAVVMAEEIYGDFFINRRYLEFSKFRYPDKYFDYNISLTDRLFNGDEVYKKVYSLYKGVNNQILIQSGANFSKDMLMQFEEKTLNSFFLSTLNATSTPIHEKFDYKAKFLWDSCFLYFLLNIESQYCTKLTKIERYIGSYNHFEVSISYDGIINVFFLQAKKNNSIYFYRDNVIYRMKKSFTEVVNRNCILYNIAIPWINIGIIPKKSMKIKLEITYIEKYYQKGIMNMYSLFAGECSNVYENDFWITAILK